MPRPSLLTERPCFYQSNTFYNRTSAYHCIDEHEYLTALQQFAPNIINISRRYGWGKHHCLTSYDDLVQVCRIKLWHGLQRGIDNRLINVTLRNAAINYVRSVIGRRNKHIYQLIPFDDKSVANRLTPEMFCIAKAEAERAKKQQLTAGKRKQRHLKLLIEKGYIKPKMLPHIEILMSNQYSLTDAANVAGISLSRMSQISRGLNYLIANKILNTIDAGYKRSIAKPKKETPEQIRRRQRCALRMADMTCSRGYRRRLVLVELSKPIVPTNVKIADKVNISRDSVWKIKKELYQMIGR